MVRFYQKNYLFTEYPNLFKNVYWGTSFYDPTYHKSVMPARNRFVEEYNIKSYIKHSLPKYLYNYLEMLRESNVQFFDHVEVYNTNNTNEIILLTSPYWPKEFKNEPDRYIIEDGFLQYEKLYAFDTPTFLKKMTRKEVKHELSKIKAIRTL